MRNSDRPVVVGAALALVYIGASRLLGPLRMELDMADRTRVFMKPRAGRILAAHTLLPGVVVAGAGVLCASASAIAGTTATPAATLATVAAAPVVTCCAAMSARRRGRAPQSIVMVATAVDPAGGGLALAQWLAFWPSIAAVLGGAPVLLTAGNDPGTTLFASAWAIVALAVLVPIVRREPT